MDSWEYPGEQAARAIELVPGDDVGLLAITRELTRRLVAVLRASQFGAAVVQEPDGSGGRLVRQVHAIVPNPPPEDGMIVLVQPPTVSD